MGRAKELWMEQEEFSERTGLVAGLIRGSKYACADLSEDENVRKFINQSGVSGVCSYTGKNTIVIDVVDLAEWAYGKIRRYFQNPDNDGLYLEKSFYDDDKEVIPGFKRVNGYVTRENSEYYDNTEELLSCYGFSTSVVN